MVEKETMEEILKVLTKEEKNLNIEIPFNNDNFDIEVSEILVPIVISSSEFKKLKRTNITLVFRLYSIPTYGYIVRFEEIRYKRYTKEYIFKYVFDKDFKLIGIKDESHMIVSTRLDDITNSNIMSDTIYRILFKFFTYNNRYGERKPFVRHFFTTTKRGNRSLKLLIYNFRLDGDSLNGTLKIVNEDSSLILDFLKVS